MIYSGTVQYSNYKFKILRRFLRVNDNHISIQSCKTILVYPRIILNVPSQMWYCAISLKVLWNWWHVLCNSSETILWHCFPRHIANRENTSFHVIKACVCCFFCMISCYMRVLIREIFVSLLNKVATNIHWKQTLKWSRVLVLVCVSWLVVQISQSVTVCPFEDKTS